MITSSPGLGSSWPIIDSILLASTAENEKVFKPLHIIRYTRCNLTYISYWVHVDGEDKFGRVVFDLIPTIIELIV